MYVTERVLTMNDREEYDINVWTEACMPDVHLVFYPLLYPEDAEYPYEDLVHGLPVANYDKFWVMPVLKNARGPKMREAYEYLMRLVNEDSWTEDFDDNFVEWTSCESALHDAPELIRQYQATLPRREW